MQELILASASPRRKELLKQMGTDPVCIPSLAGESHDLTGPDEVVCALAGRKAREVAGRYVRDMRPGTRAFVLGADTVVAIDGRILGKPADGSEAASMLRGLSGRTHTVYTGVSILRLDGERTSPQRTATRPARSSSPRKSLSQISRTTK